MTIEKIKLTNFRSHQDFSTKLSPLTIIVGPNGTGKTNIIESILLSSTTRSHRTNHDRDLINWQAEYGRIELDVKNDEKVKITTFLTTTPTFTKSYLVDNVTKKSSEIVGLLQSVLFSPETMDLIYGPPSLRRRYLDIILCQNDAHYLRALNQYNHVVRERNKLLFHIQCGHSKADELQFWNDKLITLGSKIITERQKLCDFISQKIPAYYQSTSGTQDKTEIIYKPSVQPDNFAKNLVKDFSRELQTTSTLSGPHRDELLFFLNDHPLAITGSRGECRSFLLSLKLAEIDYFLKIKQKPPVLLLDDVFSELDGDRRQRLTQIIQNQQTIITTTDLTDLEKTILDHATIINLSTTNTQK